MIYYTYKINFTNDLGEPCVVSQTKSCQDIDYASSLDECKLIVTQQAWAINNFVVVTNFTETTSIISQAEYNVIVNDPNGAEPIPDWDPDTPL